MQEQYKKTFNLELVGLPEQLTYSETVRHLQQIQGFEFIASEVDLDVVKEDLLSESNSSIDTLYLAVFQGKVDPKLVGPPFPSMAEVSRLYGILMRSEPVESAHPQAQGQWVLSYWNRKHPKDIEKLKAMEAVTSKEQLLEMMAEERQKMLARLKGEDADS